MSVTGDPRCTSARAMLRAFRAVPDLGTALEHYADITRHFSVRVPCIAEWLVMPTSREQLAALWAAFVGEGVGVRLLGGGTNTIPVAPFLQGITLSLTKLSRIQAEPGEGGAPVLEVLAGTPLQALVQEAEKRGLGGLAGLAGVPGTVGGALVMNAGGRHGSIGTHVTSVEVLEPDGRLSRLDHDGAGFGYRTSALGNGRLVVSASLAMPPADPAALKEERLQVARRKRTVQPLSAHSAGCYFKNLPDGRSTGLLIQEAGLKGRRVGGAESSQLHGNFIINAEGATGADFVAVAEQIRGHLETELGVTLEEEVKLWR